MSGSPARKVITFGVLVAVIAALVPFSVTCSKPPRPTAGFGVSYVSGVRLLADPIAGTAPLTVRFTDESSGEITSWRWNFGDGTVIEGSGAEHRNPEHTYATANTGFIVLLTVKGPGGKADKTRTGIITVFRCSEAAVVELTQARTAIQDCLSAAGTTSLDSPVVGWDGSLGMVTAGGIDAANYLGIWKSFKATYDVGQDGSISSGTDVSWGCVRWDPAGLLGRPGWMAIV